MCAESKSDVRQFVSVQHFFCAMKSKMADKNMIFVKSFIMLHLNPLHV